MSQDQGYTPTGGADTSTPTTAEEAKQAAAEAAGTTRADTEQAGAAAREEAAATVEEAKERAQEAADSAQDAAENVASAASHQANASQLKIAEGLRTAGDKVGSLAEGEGVVSDLAGKASQGLKQAGDWVSERDPEAMLTEAKTYAKNKPWVVAAAGGVALLLLRAMTRKR